MTDANLTRYEITWWDGTLNPTVSMEAAPHGEWVSYTEALNHIDALTRELNEAKRHLERLLSKTISFPQYVFPKYVERQQCLHEETHRGGAIWEICSMCGCKWADDEGGKPEQLEPKEITHVREDT
jgi:hypothetical protein